jgi:hypothetical protein
MAAVVLSFMKSSPFVRFVHSETMVSVNLGAHQGIPRNRASARKYSWQNGGGIVAVGLAMTLQNADRALDSGPGRDDSPEWWKMIQGRALVSQETSTCSHAYAELKSAIVAHAKAQEELDNIPESEKPTSEEARTADILSVAGTELAESKIREYARRDAARKKVDLAREMMESLRSKANVSYDVLVRTLAK